MTTREDRAQRDSDSGLGELKAIVDQFVAERDWQRFHTPKNIAMALAIEAAELMEHFQWLTAEQSQAIAADPQSKSAVAEEMSDVLCYLLALANRLDVDLTASFHDKMARNRLKYPAEQFQGKYRL